MDSPLLTNGSEGRNDNEEGEGGGMWVLLVEELEKLLRIAVPMAFYLIFGNALISSIQLVAGHLGNLELSAVSTALSIIFTFATGVSTGLVSAVETLSGQAFGAGQVEVLGIYMQRLWIILIISSSLMCPIYLFATPILKFLGQNDEISILAGQFTIRLIPQLFAMAISYPIQKFLQAQSKVSVIAWTTLMGLLLHVGLLWLFISVFGWGLNGAAAAFDISAWVMSLVLLVYAMRWCSEGWTGLSWSSFGEIWAFARLSLSSSLMLCLENWYSMFLVLITGHLSNAEIAVGSVSICMNINSWEVMLLNGLNAAASIRVSNELGSGRPRAAKYSVIVVVFLSLMIGIISMGMLLATRDNFAALFTDDKELRQEVTKMAYILAVTLIFSSIQPAISGVAIGSGWQTLVAYINLGCYYFLGLPLGYLFGYVLHWGVQGIWSGLMCGTVLQTIVLAGVIWKTDWKDQVSRASKRVQLWEAIKMKP